MSKDGTALIALAETAMKKVAKEHSATLDRIPKIYHDEIAFLIRMGYYEGYNDGVHFTCDALTPKSKAG